MIDITEKEQKHMKQLIGQKEADERIEESSKKSIVKQMEKKRKDTEKKSVIAKEFLYPSIS